VEGQHYLYVAGIVVTLLLAFAGYFNSVISRRFDVMHDILKDHDRRFELVNNRCLIEVAETSAMVAQLESVAARLMRVEEKLDRLLNGTRK